MPKCFCRLIRLFADTACLASLCFLVLATGIAPRDASAMGSGKRLPNSGFRAVSIWNPATKVRMDFGVWYPSPRGSRDVTLDGWRLWVSKDGAATPGRYPLILLSHDAASCRLASHDLAAALARHGFIVAAPTHPGDNVTDARGFLSPNDFINRPRHLVVVMESIAGHPFFAPITDIRRIGVLGVGAGAATALQLAGAAPDLSRLHTYCPEEHILDPLCTTWSKQRHSTLERELATLLGSVGTERLTPRLVTAPTQPDAQQHKEPAQPATEPEQPLPSADSDQIMLQSVAPGFMATHIPKPSLLAVGLLTPGWIGLFPDNALKELSLPVGIFAVQNDIVYPHETSANTLLELLPQRPSSRILQNTGHFDVQAPCPPMHLETFPALCGTQGPEAPNAHKLRNEFFVRFFQKHLGDPLPPPVKPEETASPGSPSQRGR